MTQSPKSGLQAEFSHLWYKLSGARRRDQAEAKRQFQDVLSRLGAQDTVIDLGANIGEFTLPMAHTGARVFAFEPDPHARSVLEESVQGLANVTVMPVAVGAKAGQAQLYRRVNFAREPNRASKSSSLFAEKRNVSTADAITVEIIDLAAFLNQLDCDIAMIKMDIEGAEVPLMESLLNRPIAARIGDIFVETHERALPQLATRTQALKDKAATLVKPRVNWNWH